MIEIFLEGIHPTFFAEVIRRTQKELHSGLPAEGATMAHLIKTKMEVFEHYHLSPAAEIARFSHQEANSVATPRTFTRRECAHCK